MEARWEVAEALLRSEAVSSKVCRPTPWRDIPVPVSSLGGQWVVGRDLILDRTVSLDALRSHYSPFCREQRK